MRHVNPAIKAIFFDHDDTLVGTISTKWAEHKFIAKKYYQKDLTDSEIQQHWGKPLRELVSKLYGTDDIDTAMAHNVKHHTEFEKELFAATLPALQYLKKQHIKIGVITATSRLSFSHDLQHHNVPAGLLDYTQTADDTKYHKPDPRVFEPAQRWLTKHNIKSSEVLYVGDGLHDMQAAVGAGFNFLGVETGLVTASGFAAHNAKSIPDIGHLTAE